MNTIRLFVASCVTAALAGPAGAAMLSLASPQDLSNLQVSQTLVVEVSLSGLAAGDELVTLIGSALFPASLLGAPNEVLSGTIVPDPLDDPLDFQGFGSDGQADATFITFGLDSADHITANGVLYRFSLTAQAIGSGQIELDGLALMAEQFDAQDADVPVLLDVEAGGALPFTIVPEPQLGDLNLDGNVNGMDVDPFVDVLLNGRYQSEADMNQDQVVDGFDVDPFVAAVVGGGAQQIPEPSTCFLCLIALALASGWRKRRG